MNKKDILIMIEDYAKHLHAVDYWSGKVKSSSILNPAYEVRAKLEKIFNKNEESWIQINDYAKHLHKVDYWSGKVKSSSILIPAYESLDKMKQIIDNLEVSKIIRKKM